MDRAAITIRSGLGPDDIREVARLHGELYPAEYGLDGDFETEVAARLGELVMRGWPREDEGIWAAEREGRMAGAVMLTREGPVLGRVRYFIVAPGARGRGVGRRLLSELVARARTSGYERLELVTFDELEAAAHLYREAGFRCVLAQRERRWGREIVLQRYELELSSD